MGGVLVDGGFRGFLTRLLDGVVFGADPLFLEIERIDGRNVSTRRIVCMGLAQWVNSGSLVVEDNQRFPPERWVSRVGAPRS